MWLNEVHLPSPVLDASHLSASRYAPVTCCLQAVLLSEYILSPIVSNCHWDCVPTHRYGSFPTRKRMTVRREWIETHASGPLSVEPMLLPPCVWNVPVEPLGTHTTCHSVSSTLDHLKRSRTGCSHQHLYTHSLKPSLRRIHLFPKSAHVSRGCTRCSRKLVPSTAPS